jgi:type I restriction enzyme S subunit
MNVPALRFKEFSDDWEEKKLGDIGENIIGLTYSPSNITDDKSYPIVLRSSNIKNDMLDLNDQVRVKENIPAKLFTNSDDILICTRNGSQRLIGKNVLITNIETPMTFGAFMSVYRSPFNRFMVYLFKTDNYNEQIKMNLGARINQITTKNLNSFIFCFPSLLEQTKIANFLTAVDEKITLLTKKADLLSQYKKGVMQQIFSQELRFKDDDGQEFPEWEDKRLGDFILSHKGGASLKPSDFVLHGKFEVIPKKAISSGGNLLLDEKEPTYCTDNFFEENLQSVVDKNYLITTLRDLVPSGPSIGYIVKFVNDKKYVLAQGVYGIQINKGLEEEFLIQYSNTDNYRKLMQTMMVGSTQVHIRNGDFFQTPFCVPSIKEQTKIANFLTAIDEKITNNQTQLDAVKQYKQGLLQQMFV